MIDIHMHTGRLYVSETKSLTPSYLLRFMDRHAIESAALLPIENPEETHFYVTTEQVLRVCSRHADRFVPFCNVDPRRGGPDTDFFAILKGYRERGCRGFGEVMPGLYVDDPRLQRIYSACGRLGLPIVFHLDHLRCIDEKGLPRFESMIRRFPQTVFIGHGPHFWAEVSADLSEKDFGRYPSGEVVRPGAVERLLAEYPNAYADLSAGSGWNALSRDPDFGDWFVNQYQDKLLFGTDICRFGLEFPIIEYLRGDRVSEEARSKITRRNALRLIGDS